MPRRKARTFLGCTPRASNMRSLAFSSVVVESTMMGARPFRARLDWRWLASAALGPTADASSATISTMTS